jgi:hypothetical protein
MTKIVGSIVKIQGERIALVAVQKQVLDHSAEADRYVMHLGTAFPDMPIILMGQDEEGGKFYGRGDLVDRLAEIDINQIPWQEIDVDL